VHLSNDEDSENDHLPKADSRKDWWKPLPEEERPMTPEPAWTIPSFNVSDVENNWATELVSAYETPVENSLLAKTGDMTNFLNWYCRKVNKTALTPTNLEGQAYEVVKAFYPDVIHLQFQMKECHKMLTYQVDWMNPEGDQVKVGVNRPLPLGGPPVHVHLSNDEDSENDHLPKADSRKDWWKPLPEEERPMTPEPAWTVPSFNVSDVENNWATELVSAYETPAENSLLAKTGDMTNFLNWYCRKVNKTALTPTNLEGHAYEVVKAFYPDVIHLQFQMKECHKMLTYQVDWMNPEGDQVKVDVNRPLPLGGPPVHVTIQT
nr:hypothetical protein [Tanacetum cinerariifolium]